MRDAPCEGLDAWIAYYAGAELPVLRHTVRALEDLRDDAENVNARALSSVILHDPLMTLRVLAYIEEHRRASQNADITTIERALMMIGMTPFFEHFSNLPLVEDQLRGHTEALLGLVRVVSRAQHASRWAREWAVIRHDLDIDEITVAALLHEVSEILMWCFAPTLALKARAMQQKDRTLRSNLIQDIVYHVQLNELQLALVGKWHLPQLLATLMDHAHAEHPRVKNVLLAIDLARHSANGWDDPALPDDFKAIGELLHIGEDVLLERLGLAACPVPVPPCSESGNLP